MKLTEEQLAELYAEPEIAGAQVALRAYIAEHKIYQSEAATRMGVSAFRGEAPTAPMVAGFLPVSREAKERLRGRP
jgi:hypothetical protein